MLTKEDLQKALDGHAIFCLWRGMGYIIESQAQPETYVLDFTHGMARVEKSKILEADLKLHVPRFKHWHLINDSIIELERTHRAWVFCSAYGERIGLFDFELLKDFFPDCPVGTIIKRPEEG